MSQPHSLDPVVRRELPVIAQIIQDEVWLEGERRGAPVSPDDPVVREKICTIVLQIGRDLRTRLETLVANETATSTEQAGEAEQSRAA